jgi:hypothetical protein
MKMRSTSSRLMAWLGLIMLALSLTPAGLQVAAAQSSGLPVVEERGDVAQGTGSFLEVHVVECEPGATGTPQELRDECHENGMADVTMTVRSVDPALGIDQDKTTTRINNAGPGIINTGTIPAGEYRVEVNLPDDGNTFVVGCEFFDRDEVVPATPGDARNFNVVVPQGEDVVCDLFVIPDPEPVAPQLASFDFTVTTCERADMPGDGRTFDELAANCVSQPEEPVEFTLVRPDGTESKAMTETVTVDGQPETRVVFADLPDGNYDVSSDIDLDEAANYLFCTYEGQPRYEKDFDQQGVTTFTNMLGEQVECDWFIVAAGEEEPVSPAPTDVPPTATVEPEADLTEEPPAAVAPVTGTATLTVHVNTCEMGYTPASEDFATFSSECDNRTPDVGFTLQATGSDPIKATSDASGNVVFTGLLGDYSLYSNVPLEAATEYFFCSVDGGEVYAKEFSATGVTSFTNFLPDESVECSWYIVPQNLRVDETGGTVTVHFAACPPGYEGSSWYNDCHANGVPDMPFTLTGPGGEITKETVVETTPGPGVVTFTGLPEGDYTLAGGPPQDFGSVVLYCSVPATGEQFDAPMEGGIARFTLAAQQSILCDWYFIGDDARGDVTPTPVPTEVPQRAEILVTMFECDREMDTAGATFATLDSECGQTLNDVPVTLGVPGGTPLQANTGASGDGAVRFYDLRPGDYVMKPLLPQGYANTAVFCQIGDDDVYQKPIQAGSTTFVNIEGEGIACSWFVVPPVPVQQEPQRAAGPTGSITIREFLCEDDAGSIQDWERECVPGSIGTAYTLSASNGSLTRNDAPNDAGVLVFAGLPDGYYELDQDDGVWCRAAAERVDSRSRVIVSGGANTDVFLYQCNQSVDLPNTGAGAGLALRDGVQGTSLLLGLAAIPLFALAAWQHRRADEEAIPVPVSRETGPITSPTIARQHGTRRFRFR